MPADSAMGGSARPLTDSPPGLRWVNAGNAGPFTLEGTRSYIVGRRRVAIVDPGTPLAAHVEALAAAVRGADSVTLLLTHGHPDHSGACPELAARLETEVAGAWGSEVGEEEGGGAGPPPDVTFRCLADMESVATDCGELIALETPGHARKHVVFHWPMRNALFVGDLVLGAGNTTWVGGYPGCVADYLASLDRVAALRPAILLPAHGPMVLEPAVHLERYRAHRRRRIREVELALEYRPNADPEELLTTVYGESVSPALLPAARASLAALVHHVRNARCRS